MMANLSKTKTFEQIEAGLQKLRSEMLERAKKAEGQFNDIKGRLQQFEANIQSESVKAQVKKLKSLHSEILKGSEKLKAESDRIKNQAIQGLSQLGTQLKKLAEEERKKRRGGSGSQGA